MLENVIRIFDKTIWRKVETLDLYWFTQPKLCPVVLYSLGKGSTNQELIANKFSNLSLLALQVFLTPHLVSS